MRSEIADEIGPAAWDGLAPISRIVFEPRFFGWIDLVSDDAGDHD